MALIRSQLTTLTDRGSIAASESGLAAVVVFSRNAITGDNAEDMQFMVRLHPNAKIFILWKSAKKNYWYKAYMGDSLCYLYNLL